MTPVTMRATVCSLLALLFSAPGCTPEIPEGVLACTEDADCPTDWTCRSSRCYSSSDDPDASELDAGPRDAEVPDGSTGLCEDDSDCDDDVYCNGAEFCDPEDDDADPTTGCVEDDPPCLDTQTCDDDVDRCLSDCEADPDADDDGVDSIDCGGTDCDDARDDVAPGRPEVCDDVDNDCNPATLGDTDVDEDGAISSACCNPTDGGMACGADCLDTDPNVGSGDAEVCDGLDNDCNGTTDDGVLTTYFLDGDGDTYGVTTTTMDACTAPTGYATRGGDCDDGAFGVNPGATETCNGIDDDCVGGIDGPMCSCTNGMTQACGSDVGVCMEGTQTCVGGMWGACMGSTSGSPEVCDGDDDDCDGTVDGPSATCVARPNTASTCSGGACGYACTGAFQTCDSADPGDATGCESNRNTDLAHCGSCTPCGTPANAANRACVAGSCTIVTCTANFANCNGMFADGCERAINTVSDCGSCGNACPNPPGATATCTSSGCDFVCGAGRSDCDGVASNGCETARASCDAPPPRLTGPLNAMVVTSNRPVLRFEGVSGVPDAQVQICSDPSCGSVVWMGTGTSPLTVGTSLPPGRYYWRARAVVGTTVGSAASATWNFVSFATSTPTASTTAFPFLNVAGGREDLAIGDPTPTGGRVLFYDGATGSTPTQVLNAPSNRAGFGASVSSVDVNADGLGDLIVGCCLSPDITAPPGPGCSGAVLVYQGTASGTFSTTPLFNTLVGNGFGASVAGIGDFDGDGYGDFAVGAYAADRVYIYRGSPAGVNATPLTFTSTTTGIQFGWSVAAAGDTDGDSLGDVVVGQYSNSGPSLTRATILRYRTADGSVISALLSDGRTPSVVSGVGDVNRDGLSDIVLGFPDQGTTAGGVIVRSVTGGVLWTQSGVFGTGFGTSVIGMGDIDGDGRGDVTVGVPGTREVFTLDANGALVWSVTDSHARFGYSLGRGGIQSPGTVAVAIASCGPGTAGCDAEVAVYDGRSMVDRSLRGLWSAPAGNALFGMGLPR